MTHACRHPPVTVTKPSSRPDVQPLCFPRHRVQPLMERNIQRCFTWGTRAFRAFPFLRTWAAGVLEGGGIKDVSAAFLVAVQPQGTSSAEALARSVPDAVLLYLDGDDRNEPTRGSMTLPLSQLVHLNIFALCFSAVLWSLLIQGWGCCIPWAVLLGGVTPKNTFQQFCAKMQLSIVGAKPVPEGRELCQQQWSWLSPEQFSCHPKSAPGASKLKSSIAVKHFKS